MSIYDSINSFEYQQTLFDLPQYIIAVGQYFTEVREYKCNRNPNLKWSAFRWLAMWRGVNVKFGQSSYVKLKLWWGTILYTVYGIHKRYSGGGCGGMFSMLWNITYSGESVVPARSCKARSTAWNETRHTLNFGISTGNWTRNPNGWPLINSLWHDWLTSITPRPGNVSYKHFLYPTNAYWWGAHLMLWHWRG